MQELLLDTIYEGDAQKRLAELPANSVHCCVTSPPYYGLRDYGVKGQLGLERTPQEYIDNMVSVFSEVRRVLREDGTLWLNIGDSYAAGPKKRSEEQACRKSTLKGSLGGQVACKDQPNKITGDLKPKDLIGIPWMLAFALRAEGWFLRCDIVWAKKNCMPESVKDRPTRSHEFIFLLSKSPKYYYDFDAIKEPCIYDLDGTGTAKRKARQKHSNKSMPIGVVAGIRPLSDKQRGHSRRHEGFNERWDNMTHKEQCTGMRNKRDVWTIAPAQFPDAHFATFPEEIPELCVKAGCPVDGVVLDPFMGAGTTALVASKLGRHFIGTELNPKYIAIANKRLKNVLGMFSPIK
ncbi:DNA-methyltransferase [Foetidibacter luteolus]|uniref:DNA-methyltransferase n=1 Tax=Foetidibacter luteolus TaxID=2608880 RepID=UPI00129C0F07|nr:site-specific DNA-methyltransferase [Foetidibacter luteolus]